MIMNVLLWSSLVVLTGSVHPSQPPAVESPVLPVTRVETSAPGLTNVRWIQYEYQTLEVTFRNHLLKNET